MYEFTKRVQVALEYTKNFAKELGTSYIGTEHMLYGLVKEAKGLASKILQSQNVTADSVKTVIEEMYDNIGNKHTKVEPDLTPRAHRILENSVKEAQKTNCKYVGTEHILCAILIEPDCMAVRVLIELNVDPNKLLIDILKMTSDIEDVHNNLSSDFQSVNTPNLEQFGKDLVILAREKKLEPVIGRDEEIERLIQILSRKTKNNPLIIGEAGVGKTAIVEGLSILIATRKIPNWLINKRIIMLDISSLIAGAKYRGDFEERFKNCLQEASMAQNIILFIDEMHCLIGAGAAEGAIDAANILKPFLARAQIQLIGVTTSSEYYKYVTKDSAFARRFQTIILEEPNEEECLKMLKGIKARFEKYHGILIPDSVIKFTIKESIRYITDRNLPDKAIDILDEACSSIKLKCTNNNSLNAAFDQMEFLMGNLEGSKLSNQKKKKGVLSNEDICKIISKWTKIPITKLKEKEELKYKNMERNIKQKIIGQDEAIEKISKAIIRGRIGLKDPKRPTGSFLFVGPTGVGKTALVKQLAEELFDKPDALIRLDMSEYSEPHSISKLIGSPPGYIGYGQENVLTDKVKRKPYSIILFDEIEKAHSDIYNLMLQILDDGTLTDSQGTKVDFKNTICVMTSNIGAKNITNNHDMGFLGKSSEKEKYNKMKSEVLLEVNKKFTPEFLNRLDDIIVFNKLSKSNIKEISKILLQEVKDRAKSKGLIINFNDRIIEYISDIGFDDKKGARPIKRVIEKNIEDKFADFIMNKKIKSKTELLVDIDNTNNVVIKLENPKTKVERKVNKIKV